MYLPQAPENESSYKEFLALYEKQKAEMAKMQEQMAKKEALIANLNKLLESPPFRRKYRAMARAKHRLEQSMKRKLFSPWLTENQVKAISREKRRGVKWGPEEYRQGLIQKCKSGTKGYDSFVKNYPILPSVRSLQEYTHFIKFSDGGILEDMFHVMEGMVSQMSDKELDCLVVVDEVEIQQGMEYDNNLGKWVGESTLPGHEGNAKKALVFILAGVSTRWKTSVAVYFTNKKSDAKSSITTGEQYKKIVDAIIVKAKSIGLRPCAVISDMGPDNLSMWRACNVTGSRQENVSFSYEVSSQSNEATSQNNEATKIRVMPDPIHLFKAIKASMETNKIIALPPDIVKEENLPTCVIDYQHIDDLYELESENELKVAFRLKPWNVHVGKHFKKMNVGTARSVVCHRTAVGLEMLAKKKSDARYLTTAWFVTQLNLFFELVTCRSKAKGLALSRSNGVVFEKAVGLIKKMDRIFRFMKIGKEGCYKPCQRGMRVLCASLLDLTFYFLEHRYYSYILLGRFNSDCIENIFSLIRFRQKVPTARALLHILKVITLAQLCQVIKGATYEYEEASPLPIQDFLEEARRRAKIRAHTNFYDSLEELFANPIRKISQEDIQNISDWEKNVIYDMAGSVMSALKKENSTLCHNCIRAAEWNKETLHCHAVVTEMKEFTYFRAPENQSKLQFYVSDNVFNAVLSAEITFRLYRAQTMKFKASNVLNYFVENVMYVWDENPLPKCHDLGRKILHTFFSSRLKEYGKTIRDQMKYLSSLNPKLQSLSSKSAAGYEAASKVGN